MPTCDISWVGTAVLGHNGGGGQRQNWGAGFLHKVLVTTGRKITVILPVHVSLRTKQARLYPLPDTAPTAPPILAHPLLGC